MELLTIEEDFMFLPYQADDRVEIDTPYRLTESE